MKIVYLARRPIPSVNAHSVQIVKMSEAFGKLGHDVLLLTHRGDDEERHVYGRYGVDRAFAIESFPKRWQKLRKWRFGAFLLRHPAVRAADLFFGRDIFSVAVAARLGKPVIFEAHTIPPRGTRRWRRLESLFAAPNFSHLVCVTSTLADAYRRAFKALSGKPVVVVPNAAAEVRSCAQLTDWPGRDGAIQIGLVCRPFAGKGIEMMISAAAALPNHDFHVVGASAGDLLWIKQRIPANLHLHGYQAHSKLGAYLRRFDIAVAPYGAQVMNLSGVESAAITSPLKLLEYMAAGLPIIVSDLPGVRDILPDEDAAILVEPGEVNSFVTAVEGLALDPRRRSAVGHAARKLYVEKFTTRLRARAVLADLTYCS